MRKKCQSCHTIFDVDAEDLKFYEKVSPTFGGKRCDIPPPTHCPECRQQRRLAFRNQSKLYKNTCGLCKKEVVSIYSPDKPYTVYCTKCWWSDKWDALAYGQDFDFGPKVTKVMNAKPFFKQFDELKKRVPHLALHVSNNENSDYINMSGYNKNCYLLFAGEYNEDCLYGAQVINSDTCIDALSCHNSKFCYEVVDVKDCYRVFFSKNCKNCSDSMFLYDCIGCSDCLFSSNLRNKKYHIFNKEYSKEEYEKRKAGILEQIKLGKLDELKNAFQELDNQAIHKFVEMLNCEASTGDYLADSRNLVSCFDAVNSQDSKYIYTAYNVKDTMDMAHLTDVELAYEGTSIGYKSYNIHFAMGAWSSKNGYYLDNVHSSTDLFGCVGLVRKKYCILNKQYTKEEYEGLVPKIIEHMRESGSPFGGWGEFFPMSLSPFAYNESLAFEYYPMTQQEAHAADLQWKEEDPRQYQSQTIKIDENIAVVSDKITDEVLACKSCSKNYRVVQKELQFYRDNGLPVPKQCPDCRYDARMMQRNHRQLKVRNCAQCSAEIQTTYTAEKPEKVFCEKCYLKEVY